MAQLPSINRGTVINRDYIQSLIDNINLRLHTTDGGSITGVVDFGTGLGQKLNLFTGIGFGSQTSSDYFRQTASRHLYVYEGGSHSDTTGSAGSGGTVIAEFGVFSSNPSIRIGGGTGQLHTGSINSSATLAILNSGSAQAVNVSNVRAGSNYSTLNSNDPGDGGGLFYLANNAWLRIVAGASPSVDAFRIVNSSNVAKFNITSALRAEFAEYARFTDTSHNVYIGAANNSVPAASTFTGGRITTIAEGLIIEGASANTAGRVIFNRSTNTTGGIDFMNGAATAVARIESAGNSWFQRGLTIGSAYYAPETDLALEIQSNVAQLGLTSSTGNGLYFIGNSGAGILSWGATFKTAGWTARATTSTSISMAPVSGVPTVAFNLSSGLTAGNTFSPTNVYNFNPTGFSIGTTTAVAKMTVVTGSTQETNTALHFGPSGTIDSAGSGAIWANGTRGLVVGYGVRGGASDAMRATTTGASDIRLVMNSIIFEVSSGLSAGSNFTPSPRANITASGLSILNGTTAATQALDVTGNGKFTGYILATNHGSIGSAGSAGTAVILDSNGKIPSAAVNYSVANTWTNTNSFTGLTYFNRNAGSANGHAFKVLGHSNAANTNSAGVFTNDLHNDLIFGQFSNGTTNTSYISTGYAGTSHSISFGYQSGATPASATFVPILQVLNVDGSVRVANDLDINAGRLDFIGTDNAAIYGSNSDFLDVRMNGTGFNNGIMLRRSTSNTNYSLFGMTSDSELLISINGVTNGAKFNASGDISNYRHVLTPNDGSVFGKNANYDYLNFNSSAASNWLANGSIVIRFDSDNSDTNSTFKIQTDAGTDLLTVDSLGNVTTAGTINASGGLRDFSNNASTTTGLTYGYFGGLTRADNAVVAVSDGTVALTASSTNYVELDAVSGTVSRNTVGFTAGRIPMAQVVTGGSTITSITDKRAVFVLSSVSDAARVGGGVAGKPAPAALVLAYVADTSMSFPISLTGSAFRVGTNPTATTVFYIKKNTSYVGSLSIATNGAVTVTFSSSQSLTSGDMLSVVAPSTQDATLADFFFTLRGSYT